MQRIFLLYTTGGCHLCEQATALLQEAGAPAKPIEIAGDDDLLERYGLRIPVVRCPETGKELAWPFDAGMLAHWLD